MTVPTPFPAGTYTINSAVATGGTNFQTFSAAVAAIGCGTSGPVVFNVVAGSGPYTEQVDIPQINSNSAVNTITFNGNGNTLTYAATLSTAPHTLSLSGGDFITFNNLNIVGTGTSYALVAHLWNGSNNNTFNNCTFTASTTATASGLCPFSISGTSSSPTGGGLSGDLNLITGCTMTGGYYNTTVYAASGTPAKGNRFLNNNIKDFYYYGLYSYYTDSMTIVGNNVDRLTRASTSTFYGIYLNYPTRARISRNRVHDPFAMSETSTSSAYPLYIYAYGNTAGNDNTISNNAVYNIKSNGLIYGLYVSGGYEKVYHNTVVLDHTASTGSSTTYGFYSYDYTTTGAGVDNRNNIIYVTRGGTGTKYCMYYYYNVNAISDNNIIYMGSAAGTNYLGYLYSTTGVNYSALADWQSANGGVWDALSYSADPVFNAPATGDLKPNNNALDNKGTPVGINLDLLGQTRMSPPDIGAVEFGSGCPVAANLAVASVTGTSAAISWTAVGTTGYEYVLNQTAGNPAGSGTTIMTASYNPTNLRPMTTYYFHHRVKCDAGGYSYWNTVTFTTPCVTPSGRISPNVPTRICQNQPVLLSTDTASFQSYQWTLNGANIAGATSSSYPAAATGVYRVAVNMGTCARTSDSVRLTVDTSLMARVSYSGVNSICMGGVITLSATTNGGSGLAYQWLKDGSPIPTATGTSYAVPYTGIYRVRVTATGATCPALSDTVHIRVYDQPFPQITRNGSILATVRPYMTYQWYYGVQPIAGATAATYTFTHDGSYTVQVTDSGSCSGRSSAYKVNFLGVGNVAAGDISIYPNPATDMVSVSSPVAVNVDIRSLDGKVVLSTVNAKGIDIRSLSSGMYLLYVTDQDHQVLKIEKLVKNGNR